MYTIISIINNLPLTSMLIREDQYLDPGSGSFIIQLVIASLLGAAFVVRASWSKIKIFFKRTFNKMDDEMDGQELNEEVDE